MAYDTLFNHTDLNITILKFKLYVSRLILSFALNDAGRISRKAVLIHYE